MVFLFFNEDVHVGIGIQGLVSLVAAPITLRNLAYMYVVDLRGFHLEDSHAVRLGLLEGTGGFVAELHDHTLDGVAILVVEGFGEVGQADLGVEDHAYAVLLLQYSGKDLAGDEVKIEWSSLYRTKDYLCTRCLSSVWRKRFRTHRQDTLGGT